MTGAIDVNRHTTAAHDPNQDAATTLHQCSDLMRDIVCRPLFNLSELLKMRLVCTNWTGMVTDHIKSILCDELEQKMEPFLTATEKTSLEYLRAMGVNLPNLSLKDTYLRLAFTKCEVSLGECVAMDFDSTGSTSWGFNYLKRPDERSEQAWCSWGLMNWSGCRTPCIGFDPLAKKGAIPESICASNNWKDELSFFFNNKSIEYSKFPITLFGFKKEEIEQRFKPGGVSEFFLPVEPAIDKSFCFPMGGQLFQFVIRPHDDGLGNIDDPASPEFIAPEVDETYEREISFIWSQQQSKSHYTPELEFERTRKDKAQKITSTSLSSIEAFSLRSSR